MADDVGLNDENSIMKHGLIIDCDLRMRLHILLQSYCNWFNWYHFVILDTDPTVKRALQVTIDLKSIIVTLRDWHPL